jgi:hypothetical protein
MCGAAAESAILQTAIAKTGDEKKVLDVYVKPNGRRRVMEMIFGASPSKLEDKFINSATSLLFYWRDETAHGSISTVSEIEAFHSLTMLVRLAQFLFQMGGNPLRKPSRPECSFAGGCSRSSVPHSIRYMPNAWRSSLRPRRGRLRMAHTVWPEVPLFYFELLKRLFRAFGRFLGSS